MSIFWREIRLVLDIGASDEWYGDYWIVSCCSHCTLWHSHLVGCFDIEIWLPVCDYCFSMDYGALDTSGLVFSAYLDDLGYLSTFHFVLRHFTLDTFMLSTLPEPNHYLFLAHTFHHDTWLHNLLFRLGENVNQISTFLYSFHTSFGGRSDWFFTLEHLPIDMEIIGLFHVILIAYWGIAT